MISQHGRKHWDFGSLRNSGHVNSGHRRVSGNNSPSGFGIIHNPNPTAEWVWRGEYIAVSELLHERLIEPPEREIKNDKRKVTKPIQSIALWSLGFSVYMG